MNKISTIAISGGDSWVNKGDEAILAGTLQLMSSIKSKIRIKIISGNKQITKNQFPDYEVIDRNNLIKLFFLLKDVDTLFWGGGHLIQNSSSKLFLAYQYTIILFAIIRKIQLIGFSLGAENIQGKFWHKISKWILNHFIYLSVRDEYSKQILLQLEINVPIFVTTDPAVVLKSNKPSHKFMGHRSKNPYVIISPRKWFDYQSSLLPIKWKRKIKKSTNPDFMMCLNIFAEICDWIVDKYGYHIYFLSMYNDNEQKDNLVSKSIQNRMKNKHRASTTDFQISPEKLINFMADAEFLIGMRMHSTILAACANIPIISLYYQEKGKSFFSSLELDKYAIPIEGFTFEKTTSLVVSLLANRFIIKDQIGREINNLRLLAKINIYNIEKILKLNVE